MKKILVLVMSCDNDFFNAQVNKIKETWASDILNGEYQNINFLSYKGSLDYISHDYDEKNHELIVRCEDDLENTFKKTIYALEYINKLGIEYDYIFRTNTSTYINIELLNAFIQQLTDENIVYTSELYSLIEAPAPKPMDLYGRGNGLIISKKMIDILINESINMLYSEYSDDILIGNVLNGYWYKQGKNYLDYIKSYCHGWFKAVEKTYFVNNDMTVSKKPNHMICSFDNHNTDYNFLKQFITIQTKMYYSRELEDKNYDELHEIIYNNHDDNIEETIQFNINYSNNPNIFVGSILGYLQYNVWLTIPKDKLYIVQANNKADNDIYKGKFIGKQFV